MTPYWQSAGATLYCGDNMAVLACLPDNSVDAIVTDPPYGLGKEPDALAMLRDWMTTGHHEVRGKGFMGKEWDAFVPQPALWRECLRVLKPGGHLLSFGGTRTYDLIVLGLRIAGFEIRDSIRHLGRVESPCWAYGCLSDDTEILVDGRWERYHKAIAGSRTLCYNVDDGTYSWQQIQETYVYDYCDTAFRIHSDHTDQLVTRNHRCIIERGGAFVFMQAEEATGEVHAPVVEDLHGLLEALPVCDKGASGAKQDVLEGVPKQTPIEFAPPKAREHNVCGNYLRCVRKGRHSPQGVGEGRENAGLFQQVQWGAEGCRVGKARVQRPPCPDAGELCACIGEDEGSSQPCVEGRCDLLSEARELPADQVRAVSCGVHGDGPQGRIRDGAPAVGGGADRAHTPANGGGSPQGPRCHKQQPEQPSVVCEQQGPQAIRGARHTSTTLATVTPVDYAGKVWCIRVPTGAFVARRNGRVFITGNSGFPKSHDVSKAIDHEAGAEREVVGRSAHAHKAGRSDPNPNSNPQMQSVYGSYEGRTALTAPATDAAKQWDGFGSALKPAWEPCVVARKPLDGTLAQNTLKWGCGGVNVDACRVETDEAWSFGERAHAGKRGGIMGETVPRAPSQSHPSGRWPANLIHDGSPETLAEFAAFGERGAAAPVNGTEPSAVIVNAYQYRERVPGAFHGDAGTAARFFQACPDDGSDAVEVRRFYYCGKATKRDRDEGLEEQHVRLRDDLTPEQRAEVIKSLERAGVRL